MSDLLPLANIDGNNAGPWVVIGLTVLAWACLKWAFGGATRRSVALAKQPGRFCGICREDHPGCANYCRTCGRSL